MAMLFRGGKKKQAPQAVAETPPDAQNWGWKVARELFPYLHAFHVCGRLSCCGYGRLAVESRYQQERGG
jgi:hypothetical protein